MAGSGAKLGWRVFGALATTAAAFAARKALVTGWKAVTGNEPPVNPESPTTTWAEAASWALASGAVVGLARLWAQRKAAETWQKSSGSLPPGMEEVS